MFGKLHDNKIYSSKAYDAAIYKYGKSAQPVVIALCLSDIYIYLLAI